jgi:hypothetical protein
VTGDRSTNCFEFTLLHVHMVCKLSTVLQVSPTLESYQLSLLPIVTVGPKPCCEHEHSITMPPGVL